MSFEKHISVAHYDDLQYYLVCIQKDYKTTYNKLLLLLNCVENKLNWTEDERIRSKHVFWTIRAK